MRKNDYKLYTDSFLNEKANSIMFLHDEIQAPVDIYTAAISGLSPTIEYTDPPSLEYAGKVWYDIMNNGVKMSNDFLNKTLPDLNFIKSKVGNIDESYLTLSCRVAVTASGLIRTRINGLKVQTSASDFSKNTADVHEVKTDLTEATRLMSIISNLDITPEVRLFINKVNDGINLVEKRIEPKSGCYIATCVYGSYNSKEVMILRLYRDNVLSKNYLGRIVIKIYYNVSPIVIKIFSNSNIFRKISKILLDKIITYF